MKTITAISRRGNVGASLMELLLATGVLAVLAILSFSVGQNVIQGSRQSGCISNLRALGVATLSYANDNGGYLPAAQRPIDLSNPSSRLLGWDEQLAPYVPFNYQFLFKESLEARQKSVMVCPAEKEVHQAGDYTYAQNIDLNYRLQGDKALVRVASLQNISQYVTFSDAYRSLVLNAGTTAKLKSSISDLKRHQGVPNFLYADGHVEPFRNPLVGYNEMNAENREFYSNLWYANGLPPALR